MKRKKINYATSLYLNFILTILGCHLHLYPCEDLTKKTFMEVLICSLFKEFFENISNYKRIMNELGIGYKWSKSKVQMNYN